MSGPTQQTHPPIESSDGAPAIKVGIMPLFSTYIYRCENGPTHLNQQLESLTRQLMQDSRNSTRRTNAGGWHYDFDIFELQQPVVAEFRQIMEHQVQAFFNYLHHEARKKKDIFLLQIWIKLNST